jgi:hypothetical protein
LQWAQTNKKKDEKKAEMMQIREKLNELAEEKMTEDKFWGYVMDDREDYEYGRDVLREGTYENHLRTPYSEFPLLATSWYGNKTA